MMTDIGVMMTVCGSPSSESKQFSKKKKDAGEFDQID